MTENEQPELLNIDPSQIIVPIENESFIAGEQPSWLEKIYAKEGIGTYWNRLADAMPAEAEIYERNQKLLKTTRSVIAGELPATGKIEDLKDRCELFFARLGSCNSLKGKESRDTLTSVTGRYLELAVKNETSLDDKSVPFANLPALAVGMLSNPEQRTEAFKNMQPRERVVLGTMLLDVAGAYDGADDMDAEKAIAIRNRFEDLALNTFSSVNKLAGKASVVSGPIMMSDTMRRSWGHIYDIHAARISRNPDTEVRQSDMQKLLRQQAQEMELMLTVPLPEGRSTDGWLYEYYLPVVTRFVAMTEGQEDLFTIRRALPREDQPIDGITHPDRTVDYDKYSFDFLLKYPKYHRTVFLQTKIGTNTEGYDSDISVFNYHTRISDLRSHMKNSAAAIRRSLEGKATKEDQRLLRAETLRVSALLPQEIE